MEFVLSIYNAHGYFSLQNLGKACALHTAQDGITVVWCSRCLSGRTWVITTLFPVVLTGRHFRLGVISFCLKYIFWSSDSQGLLKSKALNFCLSDSLFYLFSWKNFFFCRISPSQLTKIKDFWCTWMVSYPFRHLLGLRCHLEA